MAIDKVKDALKLKGRPNRYQVTKRDLIERQYEVEKRAVENYEKMFEIILQTALDPKVPMTARVAAAKLVKQIADEFKTPDELVEESQEESTNDVKSFISTTFDEATLDPTLPTH